MPIEHRFIQDLELLENNRVFCQNAIAEQNNVLIIGTFNPNNGAGNLNNNAEWFYGRLKDYCTHNGIVIIDLIKRININELLFDFSDRGVNAVIEPDLNNVEYFNVGNAFNGVTFNKVIYSLKWTDQTIANLITIRNIINNQLLENNCIQEFNQIKYAPTPSKGEAFNGWNDAVNGN
jgi:hypothetical protein